MFAFMGGTASAFVRQWLDFGGHVRAVRSIIWLSLEIKKWDGVEAVPP
jgi:hypothetical protein